MEIINRKETTMNKKGAILRSIDDCKVQIGLKGSVEKLAMEICNDMDEYRRCESKRKQQELRSNIRFCCKVLDSISSAFRNL